MRIKLLLIAALVVTTLATKAQIIAFDDIPESAVSKWHAKETAAYEGVYFFGMSEVESELLILLTKNGVTAQIKSGQWAEDGMDWVVSYQNLSNVKIENGKFISDQHAGEFVLLNVSGNSQKGLKINNPWTPGIEKGIYEVGLSALAKEYYYGDFTQGSIRLLAEDELKILSKEELQLMRNEIFARYGFKFKAGGEMAAHFNSKEWYRPQHTDVTSFLTTIELANIELIKAIEKEK